MEIHVFFLNYVFVYRIKKKIFKILLEYYLKHIVSFVFLLLVSTLENEYF